MKYENLEKAKKICQLISVLERRIKDVDEVINSSSTYTFELEIKNVHTDKTVCEHYLSLDREFMMYVLKNERSCIKGRLLEKYAELSTL